MAYDVYSQFDLEKLGQAEEEKYMADKLHELSEHVAAIMKKAPTLPRQFLYPECLVKQAAEQFKDQDWYINGHDGSQYYHGLQTKWPSFTMDLSRLNDRIATMDLPDYLRRKDKEYPDCLHHLSPEERVVHLLGEWNIAEEGE